MGAHGPGGAMRAVFYHALVEQLAIVLVGSTLAALGWQVWRLARAGQMPRSSGDGILGPIPGTGSAGVEPAARRVLRVSLGLLWLLDGLLQAQPAMPGHFAHHVLGALLPQPGMLGGIIDKGIYAWQDHQVILASASVWIQVGIALGILFGGQQILGRIALRASMLWGLLVWLVGEALGGLAVRGAGWLVGSPGSVLFYILAAALLLYVPVGLWQNGRLGRVLLRALGGFWLFMAALQAWPYEGWWRGSVLAGVLRAAGAMLPGTLAAPVSAVAAMAARVPLPVNAGLVAAMAVLGAGLLSGRAVRAWVGACVGWCTATWWFSMGFGVLGGTGTDPNSAPLVALIAVVGVMALRANQRLYRERTSTSGVWTAARVLAAATLAMGLVLSAGALPALASSDPPSRGWAIASDRSGPLTSSKQLTALWRTSDAGSSWTRAGAIVVPAVSPS